MYAVFVEVNADESHIDAARKELNEEAIPQLKQNGAKAAFFLAPQGGRGVAMFIFDTEDQARQATGMMKPGDPTSTSMPDITFKTVEVREVLASF